jgi:hypothetical protein
MSVEMQCFRLPFAAIDFAYVCIWETSSNEQLITAPIWAVVSSHTTESCFRVDPGVKPKDNTTVTVQTWTRRGV